MLSSFIYANKLLFSPLTLWGNISLLLYVQGGKNKERVLGGRILQKDFNSTKFHEHNLFDVTFLRLQFQDQGQGQDQGYKGQCKKVPSPISTSLSFLRACVVKSILITLFASFCDIQAKNQTNARCLWCFAWTKYRILTAILNSAVGLTTIKQTIIFSMYLRLLPVAYRFRPYICIVLFYCDK